MTNVIPFSRNAAPYPTEEEIEANPDLTTLSCSFCYRPRFEAGMLVSNNVQEPNEKFICQDCIDKCRRLVKASTPPTKPEFSHTRAPLNPEVA